ncbi:SBBP repeat-containing protein [Mechercharimyces sp. CAU 1602]|uniref:DUF7948 domain-containing protein n=1 Tax=Mechercharimyces sp. CAU 1602 TaxID=2973933 RepID=UPI002162CACC|nr:SBBP repeat-containing protein [Mechercharimyces sp. CAU 1602]MCS1351394.1 SBBP repeat-containing protein [Mechercharimyces sp. CAU 1602]
MEVCLMEQVGMPFLFMQNRGQRRSDCLYYAQGEYTSFFSFFQDHMSFSVYEPTIKEEENGETALRGHSVRLSFVDARTDLQVEGRELGEGRVHYYRGREASEWIQDVPTFSQVWYHEVWPGVSAVFKSHQERLKYEFLVEKASLLSTIRLRYEGVDKLALDDCGNLHVHTPLGTLVEEKPISFQETEAGRAALATQFVLYEGMEVGFHVEGVDEDKALIIDPILLNSTYVGEGKESEGTAIDVDENGNLYVTGYMSQVEIPDRVGPYLITAEEEKYAFISKLNSKRQMEYTAYLGGDKANFGNGIAVDSEQHVYVTGQTFSADFPVTAGALQSDFTAEYSGFLTKLNHDGSELLFSTYLGGSGGTFCNDLALTPKGEVVVTGGTNSDNFPVTPHAVQKRLNGEQNAFICKLSSDGNHLLCSTFLGGSGVDDGNQVVVDGEGNIFVTGSTDSADFPVNRRAFQTQLLGECNTFVVKLDGVLSTLLFSTYLGGEGSDMGHALTVGKCGHVYVVGETTSANFPVTKGAWLRKGKGGYHAFVTKIHRSGARLLYSTLLGGSGSDLAFGVEVDAQGQAWVVGETYSHDFPTTEGALERKRSGYKKSFITQLNVSGTGILYSTYLGGRKAEYANAIAIGEKHNIYVVGTTESEDYPVTEEAYQEQLMGCSSAFVCHIANR